MAGFAKTDSAVMREVSKLILNPSVRDVKRRTIQALVIYALLQGQVDQPRNIGSVKDAVATSLGLTNLPLVLLEEAVADLEQQRVLVRRAEGFVIDQDKIEIVRKTARESATRLADLTSEFLVRVEKFSGKLDDYQRVFAVKAFDQGLYALLRGLAESSVELLTGKHTDIQERGLLEALNNSLAEVKEPLIERAEQVRSSVYQAILDIFSTPTPKFSAGLIHLATNYVMLRALNVDPELKLAQGAFFRDARLFLDTNVIIGIICPGSMRFAHTHWLLEATRGLGVKLLVTQRTLRELTMSLRFARDTYERDHGRVFSGEMAGNEIIRTYRTYHAGKTWNEFMAQLEQTRKDVFDKFGVVATELESRLDDRLMMEYRRIIDRETSYALEYRPFDLVDHDAYMILQVQELRKQEPGSFSSPWFLTYDYKLRRADRTIREVAGAALGSTISPDAWFELIYPFLGPEIDTQAVAELFVRMLGASLLPLTPVSVKDFLSYVGHELGLEQKDTDSVFKIVERTHLFQTLQKAVVQSDMSFAVETLYAAIGEALRGGKEVETERAAIKRLAEKNQELTKQLREFELDFQIDSSQLKSMLQAVEDARSPADRKKTLEDLGLYLCESIRGWKVVERDRRTLTSELDLIVENSNANHPFLKEMGSDIPVECKNWTQPVGSAEIRDFGQDIRKRRFQFGILISRSGISGDPKWRNNAVGECWDLFSKDGLAILVLDKADIERVVAGENLVGILRERARALKLSG